MKRMLLNVAWLALSASAYERLQGPTELLFCDKARALPGYTLFGVGNRTFLLDLDGQVVHTWPVGTNPHLLENGHILDASKDDPSGFPGFVEVDWDGQTVWEYSEKRAGYAPHHDWVRIFNRALNAPTTLYIANKAVSPEQALAAGADPKYAPYDDGQMDAVVEVDMRVNGNHEQASLFNCRQTDIRHDVAVWAQAARNRFFPTPAPDGFYGGDEEPLAPIGPLKDYCAWTWGDALFVVLDCYWHSPALVDNGFGGKVREDRKSRDGWANTLGDAQYQWFRRTLEQSQAKYKFVFAHHVLGTGRGGIEESDLYEWGGRNKRGEWEFDQKRPGWELPVHQLMAKHGVTIFFQGHDHLFCRQERDGVIYQEVPMPADPGCVVYNQERYESGVKLPNAGHLRVTVAPEKLAVDYVRSRLPKDATPAQPDGEIAFHYDILAKKGQRP